MARFALGQLDLTDEQREKIRDLVTAARSDAETQREAIAQSRKALSDAASDGAAEEAIRAAAETFAKAVGDQAVLHARTFASIKEVLTEEQRDKLGKIKEAGGQFREPMRGRQGRMRLQDRPDAGWGGRQGPGPWFNDGAGPGGRWNNRSGRGAGRGPQMRPGNQPGPGPWFNDGAGPGGRWNNRSGRGTGRGPQMQPGNRPGRGPLPADQMFEQADANEDGVLSKDEIESHRNTVEFGPQFGRR